jgi:hypothetical protein
VKSLEASATLFYTLSNPSLQPSLNKGRLVGREEERVQIVKMFHDEVSSTLANKSGTGGLFILIPGRDHA